MASIPEGRGVAESISKLIEGYLIRESAQVFIPELNDMKKLRLTSWWKKGKIKRGKENNWEKVFHDKKSKKREKNLK